MSEELYLGIDGGQSHTEAVIADADGNILGRGRGGPSNHVDQLGGRERLQRAIIDSVSSALIQYKTSQISDSAHHQMQARPPLTDTVFAAAHCAMTGEAEFKEEVIRKILCARCLVVGHDAPAALAGATGGEPGVVVIAGTGSVAYGEDQSGQSVRAGGWGYLFGDEGSGFWIAKEGLRRAMFGQDGLREPTPLRERALEYFDCPDLHAIEVAVVCGRITRDRFASFAEVVHQAAVEGEPAAREVIAEAGRSLAALAAVIAKQLNFTEVCVAPVGGVFRGEMVREAFQIELEKQIMRPRVTRPRFDPAIGALLLAYRAAGRGRLPESLISNLAQQDNSLKATSREES